MKGRAHREDIIRYIANGSVVPVDVNPSLNTHLGEVTHIGKNGKCLNNKETIGSISDLTDDEFKILFKGFGVSPRAVIVTR